MLQHNLSNNSPPIKRLKNRYYIYIFNPLNAVRLISMSNYNNETKEFLLKVSNHQVIQNIEHHYVYYLYIYMHLLIVRQLNL